MTMVAAAVYNQHWRWIIQPKRSRRRHVADEKTQWRGGCGGIGKAADGLLVAQIVVEFL